MNINMANTRYSALFGRSNIAGRLSAGKTTDAVGATDAKPSKGNLGLRLSISRESKVLLDRLNEEKKQKKEKEQKKSLLASSDSDSIVDSSNMKQIEGTAWYANDGYRLIDAAYCTVEPYVGARICGKPNFGALASTYDEIRKEYEDQYTGEELGKHLSSLDAYYEDTLTEIAERSKKIIDLWYSIAGEEGVKKAFEDLFGMGFGDMLSEMGLEEDESKSFFDNVMDSISSVVKYLAQKAKEFIDQQAKESAKS